MKEGNYLTYASTCQGRKTMTEQDLSKLSAKYPHLISFTDADRADLPAPKRFSFWQVLILVVVGCSILSAGVAFQPVRWTHAGAVGAWHLHSLPGLPGLRGRYDF